MTVCRGGGATSVFIQALESSSRNEKRPPKARRRRRCMVGGERVQRGRRAFGAGEDCQAAARGRKHVHANCGGSRDRKFRWAHRSPENELIAGRPDTLGSATIRYEATIVLYRIVSPLAPSAPSARLRSAPAFARLRTTPKPIAQQHPRSYRSHTPDLVSSPTQRKLARNRISECRLA